MKRTFHLILLFTTFINAIWGRNLQISNNSTYVTPQSFGTDPDPKNQKGEDWQVILIKWAPIVAGVFVGCAFIFSFIKVPLKRGYKCRCGERTKWFIKALFYEVFFFFVIIHLFIKFIFWLLEKICPDTKDEDNKLPDPSSDRKTLTEFEEKKERV